MFGNQFSSCVGFPQRPAIWDHDRSSFKYEWFNFLTFFKFTLIGAQAELSLSHEFVENIFLWHRDQVVPILSDIQKFSLDLYFDAIDVIREVAAETRDEMAQLESNPCTEDARSRWERQVLSHGNRLNFCLSEATRILNGEYYDLDFYDKDGSRVSNHVQNQALNILSQNDLFLPRNQFYVLTNRRLMVLLLRAGRELNELRSFHEINFAFTAWASIMDELQDLMHHHTEVARTMIAFCMNLMTNQFHDIAAAALNNITQCPRTDVWNFFWAWINFFKTSFRFFFVGECLNEHEILSRFWMLKTFNLISSAQ